MTIISGKRKKQLSEHDNQRQKRTSLSFSLSLKKRLSKVLFVLFFDWLIDGGVVGVTLRKLLFVSKESPRSASPA